MLVKILPLLCLAPAIFTKPEGGWLGRLVAYHKKMFLEDFTRLPNSITVTVEEAPKGFQDSPAWNWESAVRLVNLVDAIDAKPARRAIYKALGPTRRVYLPPYKKSSWRLFPSWSKYIGNDFDYDDMAQYDDFRTTDNRPFRFNDSVTVLYISNPVEAKLPGARITVKLLKDILETRAEGMRIMPTTTVSTFSWKPSGDKKTPAAKPDGGGDGATTSADGAAPTDGGGEAKPADDAEKPAEDAEKPAEDAEKPADDAEKPAEDAEKPAEE